MVFSFFKKTPKEPPTQVPPKLPPKSPQPPKSAVSSGAARAGSSSSSTQQKPAAGDKALRQPLPSTPATPAASKPAKDSLPPKEDLKRSPVNSGSYDETNSFVFSEVLPVFQIDTDMDPIDAEAEDAAVFYANGYDSEARSRLESSIQTERGPAAERLWLMLFDLHRLMGTRAPFEALGIEYARIYEKSPPIWPQHSEIQAASTSVAKPVLFSGDLVGNNPFFANLAQVFEKSTRVRLDISRINQLDAVGCANFLDFLLQARKDRRELELPGLDALQKKVLQHVEVGRADEQACWLLALELCQLKGEHDDFEEMAINYAVTFEVSPPSWEERSVILPQPEPATFDEPEDEITDAYVLSGNIKSTYFTDLPDYAAGKNPLTIDCSALTRIDFSSAGALLNILMSIQRSGTTIVFRYPNRLVAELFKTLGLSAIGIVIFART